MCRFELLLPTHSGLPAHRVGSAEWLRPVQDGAVQASASPSAATPPSVGERCQGTCGRSDWGIFEPLGGSSTSQLSWCGGSSRSSAPATACNVRRNTAFQGSSVTSVVLALTNSQRMRESAVMISSLPLVKLRLSAGCFKLSQPGDQPRINGFSCSAALSFISSVMPLAKGLRPPRWLIQTT